ncbi:sulfatase family protein [Leeuwenhoekiella parthenopeia]|uniref:Sulfatase n=1 Tax=Leeuwenhoekiella parthenopeia TaxID=2890320 RepID=A0ABS8GPA5_9FLAO|nr:sulfatase [Leeuwenhoekiella parthenopeia]MCC4211518.1 sulfatase [Leeuwenhoekiella parthenopeia]
MQNGKCFFVLLIWLLVFPGIQNPYHAQDTQPSKPLNIVLILTDDQSAHLSVLGTPGIKTPHVDALAKKSVLFTNAFAVVPSCSPSRSSIMTGMYPHANGHWRNTITPSLADPDVEFTKAGTHIDEVGIHEYLKTLPEILQENGYYTAITQKFHMSPPWKFPYNGRSDVHNDPEAYKSEIQNFITAAGGQPFFIQANIAAPHRPFGSHMKRFPGFLPDKNAIAVPGFLADTPLMREDLQQYYGSVQLADACAGAILETLKNNNLDQNTLVIYTSDQGMAYHRAKASAYYAGLHVPLIVSGPGVIQNKQTDALVSLIDLMPTLLDFAELPIPNQVQGKSLWGILAGKQNEIEDREYVFGEHNSHGPPRDEHYPSRAAFDGRYYYILNLMPAKAYVLPADLRQQQGWGNLSYTATLQAKETHPQAYKLLQTLESGRPAEELYDMQNDPFQLENLADSQAHTAILKRFREKMATWRKETGDLANDPLQIKTRQQTR